jgi:hypothetical protein
MGSSGIKKRKRRRRADAASSAPISDGDVQRLFGRFTWNQYSPAGTLERNGFFWRQLGRYSSHGRWNVFVVLARLIVTFVLLAFIGGFVVQLAHLF